MLTRKGIRQPQLRNASFGISPLAATKIRFEMITATKTLVCPKVPANPRRFGLADSVSSNMMPPHCPPAASPCRNRSVTSRIGASAPTEDALGRQPIRNVAPPMSARHVTTTGLRPYLSPKCPASTPPTGRATKPAQNVLNASRVPVRAEDCGKNTLGNTRAAAVP